MRPLQELRAEPREKKGKGPAYQLRNKGYVPGVVYGGKGKPEMLQVELRSLEKIYSGGRMHATPIMLALDSKKLRVLPREIQVDPVTDRPTHVDFLKLEEGARVAVSILVRFKGQENSPGIKRGGVLNVVRHEVELHCPVDNIPEYIEGDLEGMDIGDSIHISKFKLPAGVNPVIATRDFTVATVAPPTTYVEEVVVAKAVTEGEVPAEGAVPLEGEEGAPAPSAAPGAAPGAAPAAGAKAAPGAAPAAPAAKGKAPEKK
ncbi:MAG: 50S ribosomal protein L25/general stress protein Ctc [Alphaproteobacteria bacterium]